MRDDNYVNGAVADSDMGDVDETQETEEIRARIEETRAEMSGTIDAIQDKISPDRLKEQAKEAVREATVGRAEEFVSNAGQTAKGFGYDMLETIKQNPMPAALAAIGLGWLFMSNQNNGSRRPAQYYRSGNYNYNNYGYSGGPNADRYGYDRANFSGGNQNKVGEMAGQAQETVGRVASQAGDKVGQLGDQVGDTVGQVGDKVGQFGDQAQYKAEQAGDWFQRTLYENPLAVGAVAAVAGAAIGLLLPETRQEHQIMGQARDNLMDKAQSTVQDTVQKVQRVAEETVNTAQDTAQQAAQDQGLTQEQPQA